MLDEETQLMARRGQERPQVLECVRKETSFWLGVSQPRGRLDGGRVQHGCGKGILQKFMTP